MRVRHPYSLDDDGPTPDGAVHWGGRRRLSPVDADGTFHVPDDADHSLDEWADGYGYELSELLVRENGAGADSGEASDDTADGSDSDADAGTCTATLTSGGTCGRDLPCPYHTED